PRVPPTHPPFPYTTLFRSEAEVPLARPVRCRPHASRAHHHAERGVLTVAAEIPGGGRGFLRARRTAERTGGGGCDSIPRPGTPRDRKSTRLNSSHDQISYA